jgi:hypothetical protein
VGSSGFPHSSVTWVQPAGAVTGEWQMRKSSRRQGTNGIFLRSRTADGTQKKI